MQHKIINMYNDTYISSIVRRDVKMGRARRAGPPARPKKHGPGHKIQPANPRQPGPSSPITRRASPRAKTGQPAGQTSY